MNVPVSTHHITSLTFQTPLGHSGKILKLKEVLKLLDLLVQALVSGDGVMELNIPGVWVSI